MKVLQVFYISFGGNTGNDLGGAGLLQLEGQHLKALGGEIETELCGAVQIGVDEQGIGGAELILKGTEHIGHLINGSGGVHAQLLQPVAANQTHLGGFAQGTVDDLSDGAVGVGNVLPIGLVALQQVCPIGGVFQIVVKVDEDVLVNRLLQFLLIGGNGLREDVGIILRRHAQVQGLLIAGFRQHLKVDVNAGGFLQGFVGNGGAVILIPQCFGYVHALHGSHGKAVVTLDGIFNGLVLRSGLVGACFFVGRSLCGGVDLLSSLGFLRSSGAGGRSCTGCCISAAGAEGQSHHRCQCGCKNSFLHACFTS